MKYDYAGSLAASCASGRILSQTHCVIYISHCTEHLLCLQAGSMCESVHNQLTLELATIGQRLSEARSMLDEADTEIKRSSIKIYIARLEAESSDLESRVRTMAEALAPGTQLASISFLDVMTADFTCPFLDRTPSWAVGLLSLCPDRRILNSYWALPTCLSSIVHSA